MTDPEDDPAGLAFNVNRSVLTLMNQVVAGLVNRSSTSGRDVLRHHGDGPWCNNLGGRMCRLQEAGLAELGEPSPYGNGLLWRLTPLGERRRAEAQKHYSAGRLGGQHA